MLYTNIELAHNATGVVLGNHEKYENDSYLLKVDGEPVKNGLNENKGFLITMDETTSKPTDAFIADASEDTINCLLLTTYNEKTIRSNGYVKFIGETPTVVIKGTGAKKHFIGKSNHYDYFIVPMGDSIIKVLESWSSIPKYIVYIDGKFDLFQCVGYEEPVNVFRKKYPEATELQAMLAAHSFKAI